MANIDDREENRVKEILMKNYNILDYGRIDKANPTNISLRIHRDLGIGTSDGYFYYKINENTLEIEFWAENFEDGIKYISSWWAVSEAELDPLEKFNQNKRKLYSMVFLPLVFSFISSFWVMFGSLLFIFPLVGNIISFFYLWKLWGEISDWKKRIIIKIKENFQKMIHNLPELDIEARIKRDLTTSKMDKVMSFVFGIFMNICSLIFLIVGIYDLLEIK